MSQKDRQWFVRVAAVALLLFAVAAVAVSFRVGQTRAAPTASPMVIAHVIEPACPNSVTVGASYAKIADLGTFAVQSSDSLVELAFHGRIYANVTDGSGLRYELRVDNVASSMGRIRATLKELETVGGGGGFPVGRAVSMGGFYEGLSAGNHTVSMWAQVAGGSTASNVMYDPGCWSSDHVLIKEYLPFGTVALPAILGD